MADETTNPMAAAIHDHLELKRRNSSLEYEMPLSNYMAWTAPEPSQHGGPPSDEAITEEVATTAR